MVELENFAKGDIHFPNETDGIECGSPDYMENINLEIKEYFNILEPDFPYWLNEYINTDILLRQQYISPTCGTIYSDLFESEFFFSNLDHSIGVALVCWHFTHNKKITLAGLFHDVATPVFKHSIDFLKGDHMTQESTEELTSEIISSSDEVMSLLRRDNIQLSEIDDYHIYPIADNDEPMLSSDRLEYSLSNGLFFYNLLGMDKIKEIYNDIGIQVNENGVEEFGFKDKDIAREFVKVTSKLSIIYREDRSRYTLQFLADIIKKLHEKDVITESDLYTLKESEVIDIIENSKYSDVFKIWKTAKKVKTSKKKPNNVYSVNTGAKIRYIDPLVNGVRISEICKESDRMIKETLSYDVSNYVYLDFDF
ncbi:MAG: hypothetical protein ACOX6Q_01345 [Candidatus Dojkabacteria bacterium]|jgi:hypothetical protein